MAQPESWQLCIHTQLSLYHNRPLQCLHHCRLSTPISLSIICSSLPRLVTKTLRHCNSFTWGRNSFPTQSVHGTLFWLRRMAPDLEVLIPIPAISHWVVKCHSMRWRSWLNKASRSTWYTDTRPRDHKTLPPTTACQNKCCDKGSGKYSKYFTAHMLSLPIVQILRWHASKTATTEAGYLS